MGLPVHHIKSEFRETWIDSLRRELSGYATIEEIVKIDGDSTELVVEVVVYSIGNHGNFSLLPQYDWDKSSLLLFMFPFHCSVKTDGQDMVDLEERIHCVFDKMSVALTPEAIERYENSRWTKFFRLFGLEHVDSLDFAHRRQRKSERG